jgi:hypothetical protein
MSIQASTIPLGIVRQLMWDEIQERIKNDNIPYEEDHSFIDENGQRFTIWIEITKDDVMPDILSVTIMIDNYPCKINGGIGEMSALFSIQNIEDCQIYANGVQVQNTTNALNDMDLSDIESFVATDWNK